MAMDDDTACVLVELTSRFYRDHATSFSATRRGAWAGWERVARLIAPAVERAARAGEAVRVLDVACGNLRFERFLGERFPAARFAVTAVDNCTALAGAQGEAAAGQGMPGNVDVAFREVDVMAALGARAGGSALAEGAASPDGASPAPFDLAVCFGFFHHVPRACWRQGLLSGLVGAVRPGGLAAVSFWQSLESPDLARRARKADARARAELGIGPLGPGDFVLGWQNEPGAYRYAHSFAADEVDSLARAACNAVQGARVAARFQADGRTGALNGYVALAREDLCDEGLAQSPARGMTAPSMARRSSSTAPLGPA